MTEFLPSMNLDLQAIFKMNDINKRTQNHLTKVYATLGGGIIVSLISGMLVDRKLLPIILLAPLFFAAFIAEIVIFFSRTSKLSNTYLKPGTFFAYAICFGGVIGALFLDAGRSDRKFLIGVVTTSLIYTLAIFLIFSLFALITVRRTAIYFGSIIAVLVLSLISIFVFSTVLESIIGLAIGVLYVIVDTQMIIHKTENGLFDVYTDAKELLIDMFKIFIEILKVLTKEDKKKNKN